MADYTHPSSVTDSDQDNDTGAADPAGAIAAAQARMSGAVAQLAGQGSSIGDHIAMPAGPMTATSPAANEMTLMPDEPFPGL